MTETPNTNGLDPRLVTIGRHIRARRQQLGYSQQEVADRTGHSRGSIANIERGSQHPPLLVFLALAEVLHAKPEDLLTGGTGEVVPINVSRLDPRERAGLEVIRRKVTDMLARDRE